MKQMVRSPKSIAGKGLFRNGAPAAHAMFDLSDALFFLGLRMFGVGFSTPFLGFARVEHIVNKCAANHASATHPFALVPAPCR